MRKGVAAASGMKALVSSKKSANMSPSSSRGIEQDGVGCIRCELCICHFLTRIIHADEAVVMPKL